MRGSLEETKEERGKENLLQTENLWVLTGPGEVPELYYCDYNTWKSLNDSRTPLRRMQSLLVIRRSPVCKFIGATMIYF